jgi:hypothetical protein
MMLEKPMETMAVVEVKNWHDTVEGRKFGWHLISVRDGLRLQEDTFRCPECLGRVRLHQGSTEREIDAHAKHFAKNPGCSLGDCFCGTRRPHPKAIQ